MLIRTWCDLQWGVPCAARTALPPAVYEFHLEFGALSAHAIIGLRIEGPSATKCLPSRPVHVLRSRQPGDVGKGRQYEIAYSSANDVQLLRQLEQTLGPEVGTIKLSQVTPKFYLIDQILIKYLRR
jgi:hypothetical protein